MCGECPPTPCRCCGEDATVLLIAPWLTELRDMMYCGPCAAGITEKQALMARTAHLN